MVITNAPEHLAVPAGRCIEKLPRCEVDAFKAKVEGQARDANVTIIEGAGASQCGIGVACG